MDMDPEIIIRTLLHSARSIAEDELDAPNTEPVLAVFYRLCLGRDRIQDHSYIQRVDSSKNSVH